MTRFIAFLAALPLLAQTPDSLFDAIRNNAAIAVTPETVNSRDRRETTLLMHAAAYGSLDTLKLLLEAGADVNAKNSFGSTALHWAAGNEPRAALLISKGADVNARTQQGRTPLMIAAGCNGCSAIVKLMLAKGGDASAADNSGTTALDLAAGASDVESMRLLLARGAQAGTANSTGFTALQLAGMQCAPEVIQLLLSKGADPHAANTFTNRVKFGDIAMTKLTALHRAAPFCSAGVIRSLIDRGAPVNALDGRGMTPLMFAVASDQQDAAVVRILLEAGADVKIKSSAGETAFDWAKKFGKPEVLALLKKAEAPAGSAFSEPKRPMLKPTTVLAAVERATSLLEKSAVEFFKQSGCVGCHHQPAAVTAAVAARRSGAKVDEATGKALIAMMATEAAGAQDLMFQRIDPGGRADGAGFNLPALAAAGHRADSKTDSLALHTAMLQNQDGHWHTGDAPRAPLQEGDIGRTVRSLRVLQLYAPPARKVEFDARVARAAAWLASTRPATNDDFAMQLVGLHWTGAARAKLDEIGKSLLAAQREDGGWSQSPHLAGDAYATGETLWALHESGLLKPADPAYQRGVQYLLRTQWPDGSWYVRSRAPKFQPYFQSGFPFDHDQWISASATSWAVMALAPAIEKEKRASR